MRLIATEGGIGAGKSTLLTSLADMGYTVVAEPIERWTEGDNMLKSLYDDPSRWGFTFQILALTSRAKAVREMIHHNHKGDMMFIERSLLSDLNVFAKAALEAGNLPEAEMRIYREMCMSELIMADDLMPSHMVHLNPPSDVVMNRMKARNREGEENIKLAYMFQLERLHAEWFASEQIPVSQMHDNSPNHIKSMLGKISL